jgi:hypothetical protein
MKLAIVREKYSGPRRDQLVAKEHGGVFGVKLRIREEVGFAEQEKDGNEEEEKDEPGAGMVFPWH